MTEITGLLGQAGRRRNLASRAAPIQQALTSPQLGAPAPVTVAYRHVVAAAVKVLAELTTQINALEQELTSAFEIHPDAEILRSLPASRRGRWRPGAGRVRG